MPINPSIPVALAKAADYTLVSKVLPDVLDAAQIPVSRCTQVLVKPNLLLAIPLACPAPIIVAEVCKWLLDKGCKIIVADSPGFGSATYVAKAIGLSDVLKPLGLSMESMQNPKRIVLTAAESANRKMIAGIAQTALECDHIFSICRIKAHGQMRLTLTVKNCFGCVVGVRKALSHTRYGQTTESFADFIAAVWASLPPVTGIVDGITCMHKRGPRDGEPYNLHLLGASKFAPALDLALLRVLNLAMEQIPVAAAISRRASLPEIVYPLDRPEIFDSSGFQVPANLNPASFNPLRLAWSISKRLWKSRKK